MSKETITLRIAEEKKTALDAIATGLDRDRSYVINQAIDAYLELYQWQVEEIKNGVAEAEAGDFATDDEVNGFFSKWANKE
jgi:predicted transcriptional regulator